MKFRKKHLALLAAAALLPTAVFSNLPVTAVHVTSTTETPCAQGTSGVFTYTNHGSYIEITACNTTQTSVTVPAAIDGVPVTTIGVLAFSDCKQLTSIRLPDSITTLKEGAFRNCQNLSEINIPDSVRSIGTELFYDCYALKTAHIPPKISEIPDNMFAFCTSLTNVNIPSNITVINKGAFYYCKGLQSISIPVDVSFIGHSAFSECTALNSVSFAGTELVWKTIRIEGSNTYLTQAPMTFGTEEPAVTVLYGDVNCNGMVDITDVLALNTNLLNGTPLPALGIRAADVDRDGKLTFADSLVILKHTVSLVNKLPL